jgi:hypothetical protein
VRPKPTATSGGAFHRQSGTTLVVPKTRKIGHKTTTLAGISASTENIIRTTTENEL